MVVKATNVQDKLDKFGPTVTYNVHRGSVAKIAAMTMDLWTFGLHTSRFGLISKNYCGAYPNQDEEKTHFLCPYPTLARKKLIIGRYYFENAHQFKEVYQSH